MDFFESGLLEDPNKDRKPQRKFVPKPWMRKGHIKMVLVTNDNLEACIEHCLASPTNTCALDLEATGLDTRVFNGKTVDRIVGVCLSPDGETGYYIPIAHAPRGQPSKHNVRPSLFRRHFTRLIQAKHLRFLFHNAKYDQELLTFNGGEPYGLWDDVKAWEDTLLLAYLRNTRERSKSLKFLSKQELGLEMFELKEIFEYNGLTLGAKGEAGFAELDPTGIGVLEYATSDAICTYLLYYSIRDEALILPSTYPDGTPHRQTGVYQIEKLCTVATRWMERCRIRLDKYKIADLIRLGEREYLDALDQIYVMSREILGRDVQPLSHYLFKDRIQAINPNLDAFPSSDERNFKAMRKWARGEAERCRRSYKMGGFMGEFPTKYIPLISRRAPPSGASVTFMAEYDITSQKQLGLLLLEMNIPGLKKTESGQIKTSKDAIVELADLFGDKFPFLLLIKRFREIEKALGTYLEKMFEDACDLMLCHDCMHSYKQGDVCPVCGSHNVTKDHTVKLQFRGTRSDTGRFTVKQGEGPSEDGCARFPLQGLPSGYDPYRPECMRRIRECIIPLHPGWFLAPLDFSGVELRIITNKSGERRWLVEYFRCSDCDHRFDPGEGTGTPDPPPPFCPKCGSDKIGDIHTLTALSIFGADARQREDWKQLRQVGKIINFLLCYGGGPSAVMRAIKCDKSEAWRIKRQFDLAYKTLTKWWGDTIAFGREHGYVLTSFGRKYPLPDIKHTDGGFRSKAERNAVNGPVQGTSADITKLAMGLIYREGVRRGWVNPMEPHKDKLRMVITMHDELVFGIAPDILQQALEVLDVIMAHNKQLLRLGWPVPLAVDLEFGYSWAAKWHYTAFKYGKEKVPEEIRHLLDFTGNKAMTKEVGEAIPASLEAQPGSPQPSSSLPPASPPKQDRGHTGSGKAGLHYYFKYPIEDNGFHVMLCVGKSREAKGEPLYLYNCDGSLREFPTPGAFMVNRERFLSLIEECLPDLYPPME